MNNFLNIDNESKYVSAYESNNGLQAKLMSRGYFIKITDQISDELHQYNFTVENDYTFSKANEKLLRDYEKESPFIITKRQKGLAKKAIFLRMFYHVYNSDIRIKDFLTFINGFNHFRFKNNLNAYDFTRLEYGEFLSQNANGYKEYGLAKYIKLTDTFAMSELEEFGQEFLQFAYENYSNEIVEYLEMALVKAITED